VSGARSARFLASPVFWVGLLFAALLVTTIRRAFFGRPLLHSE